MSLVKNIKRYCYAVDSNVSEVERNLGLPRGSIFKWDAHSPNVRTIKKVADFLGVTVDDLLKTETAAKQEVK